MSDINWARYPQVAAHPLARTWLQIVADCGRSPRTVEAYARGLSVFLAFVAAGVRDPVSGAVVYPPPEAATRAHIAQFVHHLLTLPAPRGRSVIHLESGAGLANATLQQRLTAISIERSVTAREMMPARSYRPAACAQAACDPDHVENEIPSARKRLRNAGQRGKKGRAINHATRCLKGQKRA